MNQLSPSQHFTRNERKEQIAAAMKGQGAMTLLAIARAIGMAKSPHLAGIVWEMVEDTLIDAGRYGNDQKWEYRFFLYPEDNIVNELEDLPF